MPENISSTNPNLTECLQSLAEQLDQDLPSIGAKLPQSDIALSPQQFDSLITSW